jgi:hypothetical protein
MIRVLEEKEMENEKSTWIVAAHQAHSSCVVAQPAPQIARLIISAMSIEEVFYQAKDWIKNSRVRNIFIGEITRKDIPEITVS